MTYARVRCEACNRTFRVPAEEEPPRCPGCDGVLCPACEALGCCREVPPGPECADCEGSGYLSPGGPCTNCHGTCSVYGSDGYEQCPACDGVGDEDFVRCASCEGFGYPPVRKPAA